MKNRGFTYIEILFTLVVIAMGLIPTTFISTKGNSNVYKGGSILEATINGQSIIDKIKKPQILKFLVNENRKVTVPNNKLGYFGLSERYVKKYKGIADIEVKNEKDTEFEEDLLKVVVTLSYNDDRKRRETKIITYIANMNDVKAREEF